MEHPTTTFPSLPALEPALLTLDPAQLNTTPPANLTMRCPSQSYQFHPTSHWIQLSQMHVRAVGWMQKHLILERMKRDMAGLYSMSTAEGWS
ncbi:hypothetical protein FKM82_027581 [Ascaphus truei]